MKKAYARSILLPREGEHVGSGIQAPKTPCKAAGLREPGTAQPRFAGLRAVGWVLKRLASLTGAKARWGWCVLPEELFLSLCRLQCPGPQLVLLGSRVLGAVQPTLAWGALLGPGRRRPSHAQSCFSRKENTLGVGFRLRRTPAYQQGPGSQRQPSPALPEVQRRPRCENGLRCFPEQRHGGADVAP